MHKHTHKRQAHVSVSAVTSTCAFRFCTLVPEGEFEQLSLLSSCSLAAATKVDPPGSVLDWHSTHTNAHKHEHSKHK